MIDYETVKTKLDNDPEEAKLKAKYEYWVKYGDLAKVILSARRLLNRRQKLNKLLNKAKALAGLPTSPQYERHHRR